MAKRIWWLMPMCVLIVITAKAGLTVPIRIAFATLAVAMLVDFIFAFRRLKNGRGKKKD